MFTLSAVFGALLEGTVLQDRRQLCACSEGVAVVWVISSEVGCVKLLSVCNGLRFRYSWTQDEMRLGKVSITQSRERLLQEVHLSWKMSVWESDHYFFCD
jgi:hypothetical protein